MSDKKFYLMENKRIIVASIYMVAFLLLLVSFTESCVTSIQVINNERKQPQKYFQDIIHQPYAKRMCGECHQSIKGRFYPEKMFTRGYNCAGPLILPINELCLKCHLFLSPEIIAEKGLWLHAPAAYGACTICHDPHKSDELHLLTKNIEYLCIQCHSKGFRKKSENHKKSVNCIACHNPHCGKNTLLLKIDYKEELISASCYMKALEY